MSRFFVADIGNSRIKIGLADGTKLNQSVVAISKDVEKLGEAFVAIVDQYSGTDGDRSLPWYMASVDPHSTTLVSSSLKKSGFHVKIVDDYRQIPFDVGVDAPEKVGIDRLLSCYAIARSINSGSAAAVISAGTAITVDLVNSAGRFCGGAIMPGFHLMARALKEHTANLPQIESFDPLVPTPGHSTETAINLGITAAILGGIDRIVDLYRQTEPNLEVFATGGDANMMSDLRCRPTIRRNLVLQGLAFVVAGGT